MSEDNSPRGLGIYFCEAKMVPTCFPQTQQIFEAEKEYVLKTKLNFEDAQYDIMSGKRCFIVFAISDREELTKAVNSLITIKKEMKDRQVIAVAFLKNYSDKAEEVLQKTGCSEVLRFDVSAKAFTHKIKRFLKLLEQGTVEEISPELFASGKNRPDAKDSTNVRAFSGPASAAAFSVRLVDSLEGTQDFWLFRKKVYAKKIQNKYWLVEMIGPSPSAGSFKKAAEGTWQWIPRGGNPLFETDPTYWLFTGNQPEYNWVINRWGFTSENPSLLLMQQGKVLEARFRLFDSNTIEVAQNSNYAKSIFGAIKATYDKEYTFHAENTSIPWADQINSKDIRDADWNTHDLSDEVAPNWNQHDDTDFKTGAEAMRACGITGFIKTYEVDLLEYNEEKSFFTLGLDSALIEFKEMIDVIVKGENIGLNQDLSLRGIVTGKDTEDELGKTVATVTLMQTSKSEFNKMKEAVENRQREVFSFFAKAKGW